MDITRPTVTWYRLVVSNHFLFSSLFGEDEPILTSIFLKGVESTNEGTFRRQKSRKKKTVLEKGDFRDANFIPVDGSEIPFPTTERTVLKPLVNNGDKLPFPQLVSLPDF